MGNTESLNGIYHELDISIAVNPGEEFVFVTVNSNLLPKSGVKSIARDDVIELVSKYIDAMLALD